VAATVAAEQPAGDDRRDGEGDDDARRHQEVRAGRVTGGELRVRRGESRLRRDQRGPRRQVGEQSAEVGPGASLQRAPGPVVELVEGEPSGLEVLAQLADRVVALGVRHPYVTAREAPGSRVHRRVPSLAPGQECCHPPHYGSDYAVPSAKKMISDSPPRVTDRGKPKQTRINCLITSLNRYRSSLRYRPEAYQR